jgi:hypothetical protein
MGAFGYHTHNPKPVIDFSQMKTVSVIATFNAEGKIRPDYFNYINPDGSMDKFKIESIKYTRDYSYPSRILFCCVYKSYNKHHEVNLIFYVMEHMWVIQ